MEKIFYSHGKLLLTAEYFVLDGADALAVPCKFGQTLKVSTGKKEGIIWESYDIEGNTWFTTYFTPEFIKEEPKNKPTNTLQTLQKILHFVYQTKPNFFDKKALVCKTFLEFPRNWGLGSSSTLINNIASWANIDAYALLEKSFGGSGYDIASAQNSTPILYNRYGLPRTQEVALDWEFTDRIFFVHRNKKQDSKEGIARYRKQVKNIEKLSEINNLTQEFLSASTIERLGSLIEKHETIVSNYLNLKPIKEELFPDYPYAIKSLGAWGGDFFMVIGSEEEQDYFKKKGYNTILPFTKMVL